MTDGKVDVVHFHRRPGKGNFSIEGLFSLIREHIPSDIAVRVEVLPHLSRGLYWRLLNILAARGRAGAVNHITGDVHYVAMFLNGKNTILTIHDIATFHRLSGLKRTLFKWLWLDIPINRVALVTTVSAATKQEVLTVVGCSPEKVIVVPNCIPYIRATPHFFNSTRPNILHIGTAFNKNLLRVIAALRGLNCQLTIIGRLSPEQLQCLKSSSVCYENFCDLSYDEMLDHYRRSDIVSFVSLIEGFGLPILEAQMIGRPVVTSNISSMPEVAGDAACFVDPLDVMSIRAGYVRLINDRQYRESLVERGFENAERFSPEVTAKHYAALYRQVRKMSSDCVIP